MRDLLAHRDFRLLLVGQTTSMLGDWLLLLVLGIWVKELTGSNGLAGAVFFAMAAPSLLAPLGGWLADRLPRRPLMLTVDLLTAAVVLTLLLVHTRADLWIIYAVAVGYGASQVVFAAAMAGLVQQLLPAELLGQANGTLQTVRQGLRLVGPLAGAALFAWRGGGLVAIADAATFVVSAGSLALLQHREARRTSRPEGRFRDHVTAGARHLVAVPLLRRMTVAAVITLLTFGLAESLFFAVLDALGKPVTFFGVLATFQGIGSLAAGAVVTLAIRRLGEVRLMILSLAVATVSTALVSVRSLAVVLVAVTIFGAALPALIVATMTALQLRTPNELMGRVSAAFDLATGAPYVVSVAIGAVLVTMLDYRLIIAVMTLGLLLATLYAARRLPTAQEAPDAGAAAEYAATA